MKKHELIKLLSNLKDNDEVLFWNPLVKDYQEFLPTVVEERLVRTPLKVYLDHIAYELSIEINKQTKMSPLTEEQIVYYTNKYYSKPQWSLNDFVTEKDIECGLWESKIVNLLQTKRKGKKAFDSCGSLEY